MASIAPAARFTTAGVRAPGQYSLVLRGYKKTVVVGLVDANGKESLHHFLTYQPDDPIEEILVGPCASLHNFSAGLLFPCAPAEVANEHMRGQDAKRFTWTVEFPITQQGFERAAAYIDGPARKLSYHVRKRNCVTFAHRVAKEAGLNLPRPLIQRPNNFIARVRGAIRRGEVQATGGTVPPGRRFGALPETLLPPLSAAAPA